MHLLEQLTMWLSTSLDAEMVTQTYVELLTFLILFGAAWLHTYDSMSSLTSKICTTI